MSLPAHHDFVMAAAHFSLFTSEAVVCGLLPVAWCVLRPAFSSADHRLCTATDLMERRLSRALDVSLLVAALSTMTLLAVQLQVLAELRGSSVGADSLRRALRTHVGQWSVLRLGVLAGLALVLHGRVRHRLLARLEPPPLEWWWAWAALSTALVLTISMTGHAAAGGLWGVAADSVHLAAGGTWLTGVAVLAAVLPRSLDAVRRPERDALYASAVNGFSRVALLAVPLLAVTGVISGLADLHRLSDLRITPYGHVLGLKLWLFVWVLAFGGYNHFRLRQRLTGPAGSTVVTAARRSLGLTISGELTFGILVVAATAQLVGFPDPG